MVKPTVDPRFGVGAKYRAWGCPALASSKAPRKIPRLGLKMSRRGEFTTGLDECFWWLIILTAKNVHHIPDCVCSAVCSRGSQLRIQSRGRCLPYLVADQTLCCLSEETQEASLHLQLGSALPSGLASGPAECGLAAGGQPAPSHGRHTQGISGPQALPACGQESLGWGLRQQPHSLSTPWQRR